MSDIIITPHVMSTWLGMSPAATALGAHTHASAALWDIRLAPGAVWDGATQPNDTTHVLWFALDPFAVDYAIEGRRLWNGTLPLHATHVVRAGERARGTFRSSGRVLHLYLPHAMLVDLARDMGRPQFELLDGPPQYVPQLDPLIQLLMDRMRQDDPLTRVEIDTLGLLAGAALLRRAAPWTSRDVPHKGRLGEWQTRRAIAFLLDHLDTDVGLHDVANHVGLSAWYFNRAFRMTVGVSPHRYRLLRRLERAQELLARTALPLTEIARRIGYLNADQLSRLFRKELGTTPTRYRRAHRDRSPDR